MNFRARSQEQNLGPAQHVGTLQRLGAVTGGFILAASPLLSGCSKAPCEATVGVDGTQLTVRSPESNNRVVYVSATTMPESAVRVNVTSGMMVGKTLATEQYSEEEVSTDPILTYDFGKKTDLNIQLDGNELHTYCTSKEQ